MIGSFKASMIGFATKIMNRYFFETPLYLKAPDENFKFSNLRIYIFEMSPDQFFWQ